MFLFLASQSKLFFQFPMQSKIVNGHLSAAAEIQIIFSHIGNSMISKTDEYLFIVYKCVAFAC